MNRLEEHKNEAVENAIDALARYKFMMFGYWSAIWVHLNQIDQNKESNPFRDFVKLARTKIVETEEPTNGPERSHTEAKP
jgi:hypothetical protein